jgi:hypothetical protein
LGWVSVRITLRYRHSPSPDGSHPVS